MKQYNIVYGRQGTGKSFHAKDIARYFHASAVDDSGAALEDILNFIKARYSARRWVFIVQEKPKIPFLLRHHVSAYDITDLEDAMIPILVFN